MPAVAGYLLIVERFTNNAWTTVADMKNVRITMDPGAVDVTTHRHTDANGALHQVHIPGKRVTEISGDFTAHQANTNWIFAAWRGTGTVDERMRFTGPNLGVLEGYFIARVELTGEEAGALQGSATFVPSVVTSSNTTPDFTPE